MSGKRDRAMTDQYAIEQASIDDRQALLTLWRERLGERRQMPLAFHWFDAETSPGAPLVHLLRHLPSTEYVGTSSAAPRRMLWQGRKVRAGILFDLAVAPAHRSLGPALMLARSMIDGGSARFDLLYSFPTQQAILMARRAGHVQLADLVRYARVLRHARYLSKRMPRVFAVALGALIDSAQQLARQAYAWWKQTRLESRWADQADPRIDALWDNSDHGNALVRVHDAAMARWRFDASPFAATRYLLHSDPKSGELLAWFACHEQGATLHVDDAWTIDGARGADRAWVNQLLMDAWANGCESVSFSFAGPVEALHGWVGAGFAPRDHRPVLGRWIDGREGGPRQVFLTAADEDQ